MQKKAHGFIPRKKEKMSDARFALILEKVSGVSAKNTGFVLRKQL